MSARKWAENERKGNWAKGRRLGTGEREKELARAFYLSFSLGESHQVSELVGRARPT